MTPLRSIAIACSLLSACGGSGEHEAKNPASAQVPPPSSPAESSGAEASNLPSPNIKPSPATREEAHQLVVATIGCWLGGVWSDAEGASAEARTADAERRCHEVVSRIYGADDKATYERLRAVEADEVLILKDKILAIARNDSVDAGRVAQLGAFIDMAASVERETMYARRAADRVKKDIEGTRAQGKRATDVAASPAALGESKAFDALLHADLGDLTHEARAVAILAAMDRMEIARGLPKHLKVYVVARPYEALFGVPPPELPEDPAVPMKGGAWLSYLTSVAKAAGHPVPDRAKSLADQELLAWGGTLAGLADKLNAEAQDISDATDLKRASFAVVQRIENEYRDSQSAVEREPEPAGLPRHLGKPSQ